MAEAGQKNGRDLYGKEIEFKILRFAPDRDKAPYFQNYRIVLKQGMTILDALMHIKENQDPTLNYRKSCRMGICGSCAMYVNGKPRLTCQVQIVELGSETVEVQPLPNFPILRDLVPDLSGFFAAHQSVLPYIIREDSEEEKVEGIEYTQSSEELERYLQFAYCVKCAACVSACPTSATDHLFTGPQALAAAYRYMADTRDGGLDRRMEALDHPHGLWRCHFAGACSEACPKGVDPALGIQLLKRTFFKARFTGFTQSPSPPSPKETGKARRENIPDAPEKNA